MDPNFHSSPVQSWFASVQQQIGRSSSWTSRTWATSQRTSFYLGNYNQAAVNNAAGTLPLAARRPIPGFGDITYVFNGGRSRYDALQVKGEWRARDLTSAELAHPVESQGQRRGRARKPERQFPRTQDFHNIDADYGLSGYHQPYNSTTSFVWSLPFGHGRKWGQDWSGRRLLSGGWQLSGVHTLTPGEMVTLVYSPTAAFQVSAITNDFSGANNYRPNITCDPYAPKGQQSITNWFNPACVIVPTDPSQPFGDAPRNNVRGPNFRQFDLAAIKNVTLPNGAHRAAHRGVQSVQSRQLRAAGGQPQRRRFRHHHVATTRARCSLASRWFGEPSASAAGRASAAALLQSDDAARHRAPRGEWPPAGAHPRGYTLAIAMGADVIEPDLVSTKDGVLIARHENEIGGTTDVAQKFAARKTTKKIDGASISGWFTEDFTLAEIKTLRARERLEFRSHDYDGKFTIPTFEEVVALAETKSRELGRPIGIYPETKHPTYFRGINLSLEDTLLQQLKAHKLTDNPRPSSSSHSSRRVCNTCGRGRTCARPASAITRRRDAGEARSDQGVRRRHRRREAAGRARRPGRRDAGPDDARPRRAWSRDVRARVDTPARGAVPAEELSGRHGGRGEAVRRARRGRHVHGFPRYRGGRDQTNGRPLTRASVA